MHVMNSVCPKCGITITAITVKAMHRKKGGHMRWCLLTVNRFRNLLTEVVHVPFRLDEGDLHHFENEDEPSGDFDPFDPDEFEDAQHYLINDEYFVFQVIDFSPFIV